MNISIGVCSLLTSHFVTLIACPFSLSLSLSLSLFYSFGLITRSDRLVRRSFRSEFSFIENACNPQETQRQPTAKSRRCPFLPEYLRKPKKPTVIYPHLGNLFSTNGRQQRRQLSLMYLYTCTLSSPVWAYFPVASGSKAKQKQKQTPLDSSVKGVGTMSSDLLFYSWATHCTYGNDDISW